METVITKVCKSGTHCADPDGPCLPLSSYPKQKRCSDGTLNTCKACKRAAERLRYANDSVYRATILANSRKLRAKSRDIYNAKQRVRYKQHAEQHRQYDRARYKTDSRNKAVRQRVKAWYKTNRDRARRYHSDYFNKHADALRKHSKQYYIDNIESCRKSRRDYVQNHRWECAQRVIRWYRAHPDKRRPKYAQLEWAVTVHEASNWQCLICECTRSLNAHHKISYCRLPQHLKSDTSIGVTLCKDCHKKYHRVYGKGHNTRRQFDAFVISELFRLAHNNEIASDGVV